MKESSLFAKLYVYFRIVFIKSTDLLNVAGLKCTVTVSTQASACRTGCLRGGGVLPDVDVLLNLRQNEQTRLFSDVVAGANVTLQENKYMRDFIRNSERNGDFNASDTLAPYHQCLLTSVIFNFEFACFYQSVWYFLPFTSSTNEWEDPNGKISAEKWEDYYPVAPVHIVKQYPRLSQPPLMVPIYFDSSILAYFICSNHKSYLYKHYVGQLKSYHETVKYCREAFNSTIKTGYDRPGLSMFTRKCIYLT